MVEKFIVTIDGSGWTGKSTVAKALSKLLNYQHLNTGSMFRAVGYLVKQNNINPEDKAAVINLTKTLSMEFRIVNQESRLFVNGEDFTFKVSNNEAAVFAAKICHIPQVREELLRIQQEIGKKGGFVVEGRDTGTIVFPNAERKFYLDANTDVKVKRFYKISSDEEKKKFSSEKEVKEMIERLDYNEKNRETAPLIIPEDAIYYDNSLSPTAEQDAVILWYYINSSLEIIQNHDILKLK